MRLFLVKDRKKMIFLDVQKNLRNGNVAQIFLKINHLGLRAENVAIKRPLIFW